jgi:hypothetical protein
VEGVDLFFTPRVEEQMQVCRRWLPVHDVEIRETGSRLMFCDLRDSELRKDCFVETSRLRVVARVEVDMSKTRSVQSHSSADIRPMIPHVLFDVRP